jgi:outer membrane protein OmpA-like peptidoglycan-associated protein
MHIDSPMTRGAVSLVAVIALVATSCSSTSKKGAGIGGAVGAGVGAIIGNQSDRTGTGAVVGGAVGAAAGAIIGDYMHRQKKELEQIEGVDVVQDGEQLRVKFENAILFDTDSYTLKPTSKDELQQMADVLNRYPDTNLQVVGHTDNTGSDAYNQRLSEQRAYAVKDYLVTSGVAGQRLNARGLGEQAPIASNDSPDGRQQNRRVEVHIAANETLQNRATQEAQQNQR